MIEDKPLGSSFGRAAAASFGFVERNFTLVKRYLGWEVVFLAYNAVSSLSIALIGISVGDPNLTVFLVIGALMWGFLGILFHEVSESVAWERWEGTIEYTFMAPIRRFTMLIGTCFYAVIYGLIRSTLILVLMFFFLDLNLPGANWLGAVAIIMASSLSFVGLGLVAATLPLLSPEKGPQATHLIQALIMLVSGVYYDVSVLPAWMQPASWFSPATYTLRSVRICLLEGASFEQILPDLGLLLVMGLLLIPMGLAVFGLAERRAKRTGKLKRSG